MRGLFLLSTLLLPSAAVAQDSRPQTDPKAVRTAIETWVSAPPTVERRAKATEAVLDAGRPGLELLGGMLAGLATLTHDQGPTPERARLRALESLTTNVALQFIERVEKSKMQYAGQYDDLRALQPHVGHLYLTLLLDPPQWFPETRRPLLVPALRDLYPESPGEDYLEQIREIAEDENLEMWELRLALFSALAQWGDRELIDRRIAELRTGMSEGDAEDRLHAAQQLAYTYYVMRDYANAARTYREFLRGTEDAQLRRVPADYYNAACAMSLSGDVAGALDELERCVELMKSETVDPSMMLERKLFEKDPEIDRLRKTERFAALMKTAFPAKGAPK